MNPLVQSLAKELAEFINKQVNIPFIDENQEQVFFELVVTKVLELTVGTFLKHLENKDKAA